MPQTNVSSCVLSIITSFSSGLDVFKKLRDTRYGQARKIKKAGKPPTEKEITLLRSLRQGPEDIGREYQRSVQILGDGFAVGDSIAQNSLAEVLLKLNTGLVNIINTFLSRGTKTAEIDYQSLTALSDKSRIDTCRTLRQLYRRMLQLCTPLDRPLPEHSSSEADRTQVSVREGGKRKKAASTVKQAKTRAPVLARVVVENSAKRAQLALVKPGERRKKSSRPGTAPRLPSASSSRLSDPAPTLPAPGFGEAQPASVVDILPSTLPEHPRPRRNMTSLDVGAPEKLPRPDVSRATHSTPNLENILGSDNRIPSSTHLGPPIPRRVPRIREPVPTYYSIASGSTRLGEIPLHKWSEPYDFDAMSLLNREAARNGWPVEHLQTPDAVVKKKRFGIFRFLRRNHTAQV